jgi:hypothetical protein
MNERIFWGIIELANKRSDGNMTKKCQLIKAAILRLSKIKAFEFARLFQIQLKRADTWHLYDASEIIVGKNSEKIFEEFCSIIISMGRDVSEAALDNPETLADLDLEKEIFTDLCNIKELVAILDFNREPFIGLGRVNEFLERESYCMEIVRATAMVRGEFPMYGPITPIPREGASWGYRRKERFPLLAKAYHDIGSKQGAGSDQGITYL